VVQPVFLQIAHRTDSTFFSTLSPPFPFFVFLVTLHKQDYALQLKSIMTKIVCPTCTSLCTQPTHGCVCKTVGSLEVWGDAFPHWGFNATRTVGILLVVVMKGQEGGKRGEERFLVHSQHTTTKSSSSARSPGPSCTFILKAPLNIHVHHFWPRQLQR